MLQKSLASCHSLLCQNWNNLICPSPTVLFLQLALLPNHIWSPFQTNGKSTWHKSWTTISNNPSHNNCLALKSLLGLVHHKTYRLLYFPVSTASFCLSVIYFSFVPLHHDLPPPPRNTMSFRCMRLSKSRRITAATPYSSEDDEQCAVIKN